MSRKIGLGLFEDLEFKKAQKGGTLGHLRLKTLKSHFTNDLGLLYISDSFEQEYEVFVTAARVMTELGLEDSLGWHAPELQNLSPEQAAQKIMEMFPDHPLYGMDPAIPVYQVRGARGLIELVKQAWALLRAA